MIKFLIETLTSLITAMNRSFLPETPIKVLNIVTNQKYSLLPFRTTNREYQ